MNDPLRPSDLPRIARTALMIALAVAPVALPAASPSTLQVARSASRLAATEVDQVSVAWSPDGKKLAWLQRKEAGSGIFNVWVKDLEKKADAAAITRDADGASAYSLPIWSPNGHFVGFLTTDGYYKTASASATGVTTTSRVRLTCLGGNAGHVALQGRYYLAARIAGQISLLGIRPDGSLLSLDPLANAVAVTDFGPGVRVLERRIAPDHSRVAFAVEEGSGASSLYMLHRVPELLSGDVSKPTSLTDPSIRRLTDGASYDGVPSFGGDGSLLVMASAPTYWQPQDCVPNSENSESLLGGGRFDLVAIAASGTGPRSAVAALNTVRSETFPTLSPDGMKIAFVRDDSGVFQVYTADLAYADDIASTGGTRNIRDATGSSVEIPDGALAQSTQIIISLPLQVPDRDGKTMPAGVRPVRAVRAIEKSAGDSLRANARISLAYTDAEAAGLDEGTLGAFRFDTGTGKWALMGGTVDRRARTVTFQSSQLGTFGVAGFPATGVRPASADTSAALPTGGASGGSGGCSISVAGQGQPELASMLGWMMLLLAGAAHRFKSTDRPRRP
ncbi:MAG: PD40 domain-containing protein [Candidatus Wallbacteria bacterium]|nr:PD40 domain-containing protein [Candidatus Wallbacteria bacterium]